MGNITFEGFRSPPWYAPVRAKVNGTYFFYRHMKENTKDFYQLKVIKYKKRTFENGSETIEIEIKFSIPGCQKVARVKFLDKDCNEKQCYPLPIEIGECIPN